MVPKAPAPGFGGKIDLVVKSIVIALLGWHKGPKRPILGSPRPLLQDLDVITNALTPSGYEIR